MRITNKIMQNNSLFNINNNKVTEDQLNTMMSTGKKITRPSDDPVIAIRALRLRSNVTQLSQYYEKNAKDAQSWLEVTADALSTVTSVLTDCVKQATKGANKDLTLDDMSIIVTQMEALAKEYYSTGNVDYAGRYIFTGYRTDTPLTFDRTTTAHYEDINDEFTAGNVQESKRILGKYKLNSSTILSDDIDPTLEHEVQEVTVGRIRLSYDRLNYIENTPNPNTATLKYREALTQPATSSVNDEWDSLNLTFKDKEGFTRYAAIPITKIPTEYEVRSGSMLYTATSQSDGTYLIEGEDNDSGAKFKINVDKNGRCTGFSDNIESADTSLETRQTTEIRYTNEKGPQRAVVPLLPAIDQSYTVKLDEDGYEVTVNSDGTYTLVNTAQTVNADGSYTNEIVQITGNGSVFSSYKETSIILGANDTIYSTTSEEEIDEYYEMLLSNPTGSHAVFNAFTGEILLNKELKNKLETLPDLINAKSIDVVYDKEEWQNGDIRPEHLFACRYTNENKKEILYNMGSANHSIAYDVGFAQSVVVNTTADEVFTTNVTRDVNDLSTMLDNLKQVDTTITILKQKLESTDDVEKKRKVQNEIDSATKAYDYLREEIQKEFEHKITSMQKALDVANVAVTDNGTRSKRLDLVNSRLMEQTTTFKTLQSDNEDIDLAEAATQLTSAQVTYEASLMATGKISQSSLMNYI